MIIDAKNQVLGRVASFAAKQALLGKNVHIINTEEALISGRKKQILDHYKNRRSRGVPAKGPFFPRSSDLVMRRTVRGMLPYKKPKGESAFKRVKCYLGNPELKGDQIKLPFKTLDGYHTKLSKICVQLGGKQ